MRDPGDADRAPADKSAGTEHAAFVGAFVRSGSIPPPTDSLDAYDYYLRGLSNFHSHTRHGNDDALALFLKAIELDPNYAAAYGMAAYCRHRQLVWGWSDDRRVTCEGWSNWPGRRRSLAKMIR